LRSSRGKGLVGSARPDWVLGFQDKFETVAKRINPVFLFPAKKPVTGSS
jgi:hypothetical protein